MEKESSISNGSLTLLVSMVLLVVLEKLGCVATDAVESQYVLTVNQNRCQIFTHDAAFRKYLYLPLREPCAGIFVEAAFRTTEWLMLTKGSSPNQRSGLAAD